MFKIIIPGEPRGKGRPRFDRGHAHTDPKTAAYEQKIKDAFHEAYGDKKYPKDIPLDLRIVAYYGIPQSDSKKKQASKESHEIRPTKKPDFDNMAKIVADALNNVAYHDDSQVVDSQFRKFYSRNPRVVITIKVAWRAIP